MNAIDHIKSHDEFAKTYDSQVKQYHSYGSEVLFGLCYEYVKPGDHLLDLGIGTGLSSIHFAKVGLFITGLDGSAEMLKECRKKAFAKELKQYNIQDLPLPYSDNAFSHVICCGVFHFFSDLMPIMKEAYRVLNVGGIFGFTIASLTKNEAELYPDKIPDFIEVQTTWGIPISKHSNKYIEEIARSLGMTTEKEQKILSDSGDENSPDILFKAIVMQKIDK
jgi:ubiquinone/menaquinone biosynthesis C-methylase UbiE